MIFTFTELFHMIVMILASGYIFQGMFPTRKIEQNQDPAFAYLKKGRSKKEFVDAILLVGVPIILHEFAHKFVAIAYGLEATFNAAFGWLAIGVVLKLIGSKFLFLVPAYVTISGGASAMASAIIAFSGPAVHLALFLGAFLWQKFGKVPEKYILFVHFTKYINGFLFVLNMLPIPFFDGMKVWSWLFGLVF